MMCSDDLKDLLFYGGGTLDQIYSQTANDDSDEDPALIALIEATREMPNRSPPSSSEKKKYSDIYLSGTMPLSIPVNLGHVDNGSTIPDDQCCIDEGPKFSEAACPVELNHPDDQINDTKPTTTEVMKNNSASDLTPIQSDEITENLEMKSLFVKTTDLDNFGPIVVKNEFYEFPFNLTLMSLPVAHQQLRYASDRKKGNGCRRVVIENDDMMRIQIPDIRIYLHSNLTPFLRIARLTTISYEQKGYIFIHPYPLWMKNQTAQTYRGCLFMKISREMFEKTEISFDTLIMIHEKQTLLKKIKQLRIHRDDSIDQSMSLPDGFKVENLINKLNLNTCILFFQIFLFDEKEKTLFPTNICCQTGVIHHHSGEEMKKFRQENPTKQRTNLKRLQKSSS